MDQIPHFSRYLLNGDLPTHDQERVNQGGSVVGICLASFSILMLVMFTVFSICKFCSIRSSILSSNNQQNPTTSNACSREPEIQTHQELVALPLFVFGEQTPPSTTTLLQSEPSSPCSFSDGNCAICLSDYAYGESIRVLPRCKHMFHKDCIDHWLSARTLSCPICRDQIIDKNVESTRTNPQTVVADLPGSFTLFPYSNGRIQNYL